MRLAAIVLLAALALAACGLSTGKTAPAPSTNTPDATVRTYLNAVKQGDCQTVNSLLSTQYKTKLGGDTAIGQWCGIASQHASIVPATDVTVLTPQTTGTNQATVPVTHTDPANTVQEVVVDTVMEGNSWKVQDIKPGGQLPSPSPSP